MDYEKKLESIFKVIDSKAVPFPHTLQKKHISYLTNANAVALIRSLTKDKRNIEKLSKERPVQRLLNTYSTNECAFILTSNV